jgi:hypothetical protein
MVYLHRAAVLFGTAIPLMIGIESDLWAASASAPAATQAPSGSTGSATQAAQPVGLPKAYESIVLTLGTLATSGTAALKTKRSDERTLAIRSALTNALLSHGTQTTIKLDPDNKAAPLGEVAMLCNVREDFVNSSNSLNFVSSLISQVTEVSKPAPKPGDLVSAFKLLFATSSYSISDKTSKVPEKKQEQQFLDACDSDLKSYETAYYGAVVSASDKAVPAATDEGLAFLNFLGPVGVLINSFISVVQPIFIDAATIVDEQRREEVIVKALHDERNRIDSASKQLAVEVDNFAIGQRRNLAGSFVEQLVAIREKPIDISKIPECQSFAGTPRLPSGAPSASFITCWKASWAQIDSDVTNLLKTGDQYDALADAGNATGRKQIGVLLADYEKISAGKADASDIYWDAVTQFVSFANAVANAASTLQKDRSSTAQTQGTSKGATVTK